MVWCYDVDTAEDANLTEGDMHLARTPISTFRVPRYHEGQEAYQGLSLCLVGGAGGGKGGWEGTSNSLIVIYKKMAEVTLVCTAFRPNFLADRPISPLD